MQLGVTMLECGHLNSKSTSNLLIKNVLDMFISAIAFYLIGYSFMNESAGGFLGGARFFLSNGLSHDQIILWLYQFSFCSTAGTIVSGALSERVYVDAYLLFSFLLSSFIFPIAAAWCWGGGWLQVLGFKDFAGSGVVHLLGGASGLVGTIIIGPRLQVFSDSKSSKKLTTPADPVKPTFFPTVSVENTDKKLVRKNSTALSLMKSDTKVLPTITVTEDEQGRLLHRQLSQTSPEISVSNSSEHNIEVVYRESELRKKTKKHFEHSSGRGMRERIRLFKQEFFEFSGLSDQTVRELVRIYDTNEKNFA